MDGKIKKTIVLQRYQHKGFFCRRNNYETVSFKLKIFFIFRPCTKIFLKTKIFIVRFQTSL